MVCFHEAKVMTQLTEFQASVRAVLKTLTLDLFVLSY